jgi:hypothetical protein
LEIQREDRDKPMVGMEEVENFKDVELHFQNKNPEIQRQ